MGPNELAIPALQYIVNWMIDMGKAKRTSSIRLMYDFLKNMAVRRTAILMGMSQYVAHFTKVLCDAVREGLDKEQMGLVERLSLPDDAVFDCLANCLAMKREWGVAGEEDEMERFLARHPKLGRVWRRRRRR
ncbi:hypothetical protein BCR34DRAFT_566212 [Clohesyomyces aquaticus]|uniref:BTB domain-containing protein n=1 Tax=Clohesyomyces aquaticus TaxID=1231657 RepID=A0A1Y1ZKK9_9PLEO|nr:hypothetical protein BCR34DRAFT_566212 [Clohesyomyces aquaticus]